MRTLVTGAAGFIGSHLCEALLAAGDSVVAVDCLSDYYARPVKEANLALISGRAGLELHARDLATGALADLLADVAVVYHLAGQPGVRGSFGDGFDVYLERNVKATQRLLEAMTHAGTPRLVFASSSSVYGDQEHYPVSEQSPLTPQSPYGVTKLACEALVTAYGRNSELAAASLRYFTVFGPRQRPDMAFHKFVEAVLDGHPISLYGAGALKRDYTFVADAVAATMAAGRSTLPGHRVYNIGGGNGATNGEVVTLIEDLTGRRAIVEGEPRPRGDVRETAADVSRARAELGFVPRVKLRDGLEAQIAWHRARRGPTPR